MSTIKFIVEIDEQYVRDCANPVKNAEMVKNGGGKNDYIKGLMNTIVFGLLEKEVDAGTTEFVINRDNFDERVNGILDHVLGNLAALAGISKKDKDEEKGEETSEV